MNLRQIIKKKLINLLTSNFKSKIVSIFNELDLTSYGKSHQNTVFLK